MTPVAAPGTYLTGFCVVGQCGRCHGAIATKCTHTCHGGTTEAPAARPDPLSTPVDTNGAPPAAEPRKKCACGARWSTTYGCMDQLRHEEWMRDTSRAAPEPTIDTNEETTVLETLPIDKITVDPANRPVVEDEALAALAESIKEVGVLEPVLVSPNGGGAYHLVAGARRLAASVIAGKGDIPAIVTERDGAERAVVRGVENIHRRDLTAMEEARVFADMAAEGLSQRDIARRCSVSQPRVSKRMKLLKLPADVQRDIDLGPDDGGITIEAALALTELPRDALARVLKVKADDGAKAMMDEVDDALAEIEQAQELAAKRKALTDAGATVVDGPPKSPARRLGKWDLDVDAKKHAAEPCQVVFLSTWGHETEYCGDPKRHNAKGASALKVKPAPKPTAYKESPQAKADREARVATEKALDEAAERRQAFAKTLLPTKAPKIDPSFVDALRQLYTHCWTWGDEQVVAGWLGVELPADYTKANATMDLWIGAATPLQLAQLTAALVLAGPERDLCSTYRRWDADDVIAAHFARLVERGYEPNDFERERLAGPKKAAPRRSTARKATAKKAAVKK